MPMRVVANTRDVLGAPTPVLLAGPGRVQDGPRNYTWQGSDYPMLTTRLAFGTAMLRVDLVKPDIRLPTTLNKDSRRALPAASWWRPSAGNKLVAGSFDKVPIIGTLFERDYLSRNDLYNVRSYDAVVPNTFADGRPVPHGQYRALLRALKVGGDPSKEEDFEVWPSPTFGYVGK